MLTQISLQTGLHVTVPLREALKHPPKELLLVLEPRRQVVHIGVRRLGFEPDLGVGAAMPRLHMSPHPMIMASEKKNTTHRITCSILQQ